MPWGPPEKENWFKQQVIQRSYHDQVVSKIRALSTRYELSQYGALSQDPARYPLFLLKSKNFSPARKTVLITGGVHGYETSGVHGALEFMETTAQKYTQHFNFVCAPCISPWSYETINRWNARAIDPNRSFRPDSPAEESKFFVHAVAALNLKFFVHIDLHETTDTDNTVFRPALEARDGIAHEFSEIPDGFYLVGDSRNPCKEFQHAIIQAVEKVTHIAPADEKGQLIGTPLEQRGVVNYDVKKLFLCTGFTDAEYNTTTEVYPDSSRVTPEICVHAQVAAIVGGLDFLREIHQTN